MTITDLANKIDLPLSTVRNYRDRYPEFYPTVAVSNNKLVEYPEECLEITRVIAEAYRKNWIKKKIKRHLNLKYSNLLKKYKTHITDNERKQEEDKVASNLKLTKDNANNNFNTPILTLEELGTERVNKMVLVSTKNALSVKQIIFEALDNYLLENI